MNEAELKQNILDTVEDLVGSLMYYDRKEDESLPRGAIEKAIEDGVITKQEIIDKFAEGLDDE